MRTQAKLLGIIVCALAATACGSEGGDVGAGGTGGVGGTGGTPIIGACCALEATCSSSEADACTEAFGTFYEERSCVEVTCAPTGTAALGRLIRNIEEKAQEDLTYYRQVMGIVGREFWNLNGVDPGYTNELLGRQGATIDPDSPFTTRIFSERYELIEVANKLLRGVENAEEGLFNVERTNAMMGYVKTWHAYSLILLLNHQFENGIIPLEALEDEDPGASALDYLDSLQYIADLLDDAAILLTNGGPEFLGIVPSAGFSGFSTPATWRQFNRALSARVRLYQGDKSGAISGIAGSFFNINGSMFTGPKSTYDGLDSINPMFFEPNVDLYTVHPDFLADADPGDLRVSSKSSPYTPTADFFVPVSLEGLVGDTQVDLYRVNDPLPMFRNEELILIYAEAQIGSDVNEVLAAINRVRNAAGLGNYLGATDDASLLNEVLKQRRYSFFGEGHRWVDLRRTGKLGEVNIDRVGDIVHSQFPRPDTNR